MTTIRRKQRRLLEKLAKLDSVLLVIKAVPQGSSNPAHPSFDPDATYVRKRTLVELLDVELVDDDPSEDWDDPDY